MTRIEAAQFFAGAFLIAAAAVFTWKAVIDYFELPEVLLSASRGGACVKVIDSQGKAMPCEAVSTLTRYSVTWVE